MMRNVLAMTVTFSLYVSTHAFAVSLNVFGDSLSDSGNMFALSSGAIPPSPNSPIPGPYSGRFSNGNTWVEYLSGALGTATNNAFASQSLNDGVNNFAVGGSYSGSYAFPPPDGALSSANSNDRFLESPSFPGIQEQIGFYGMLTGNRASPDVLNVFWTGANDLVFAETNGSSAESLAVPVVANVRAGLEQLIDWGAEKFLVMNLPDVGRSPFGVVQSDGGADLSRGSLLVNLELETMVTELRIAKPHVSIEMVDIYSIFYGLMDAVATDPVEAGFPDASVLGQMPPGMSFCFNVDSHDYFCSDADPNDRVFFDVIHPSSRVHALISTAVEDAIIVPEPPILRLLALGLLGLGALRRPIGL